MGTALHILNSKQQWEDWALHWTSVPGVQILGTILANSCLRTSAGMCTFAQARCLEQGYVMMCKCLQDFPANQVGKYVNKVDFGLVQADLLANFKQPARDRILVAFEYIDWQLGPFKFRQASTQYASYVVRG
jgi:hypothetical protein